MNECLFSPDRRYRYSLTHDMRDPLFAPTTPIERIVFIGLNPSKADESVLDPTLRRIRGYTRLLGGNLFVMLNLFSFRATDPKAMLREPDPVGPQNDEVLAAETVTAKVVVLAWGCHGTHRGRDQEVRGLLKAWGVPMMALRLTKEGHPEHPLYLPGGIKPIWL